MSRYNPVRRFLHIVTVLALCQIFLAAQPPVKRETIITTVSGFLAALQSRDLDAARLLLSQQVSVSYFTKREIKQKIDALIMNEISAMEYLTDISGYNCFRFFQDFEGVRWELAEDPVWKEEPYEDDTYSKGETTHYYFIKVKLSIKEVEVSSGQTLKTFSKIGEIDMMLENGDLKIFGFII